MAEESGSVVCKSTGCNKLNIYNWLAELPEGKMKFDIVEIRFKSTRKGYFCNVNQLVLKPGDIVAVEASPGHDIGIVSLTGALVYEQMKKAGNNPADTEFKKIYRKAKQTDIEKWKEAISLEHTTMIKARKIASELKLDMKIGDVEYQGDHTKAIFYYIADERVDFRELIKILADEFRIRIEMRQIGARQEAGRIGGIGSCGQEICCTTWISNFNSVTTNAARYQELSLNPQKLAGQCGKLKCCLNYELECYIDASQGFPDTSVPLETDEGTAYHQKTDVYKGIMWYSFDKEAAVNLTPVPVERVKEIIGLNLSNRKAAKLIEIDSKLKSDVLDYENVVGQDSLTRFDNRSHRKKKKRRNPGRNHDIRNG
ncbi:MAG: hypothetical protein KJ607_06610 [Bacteroidetes bacterium]|nr:hypothetical protein [Bacteroidota bacterium]